MTVIFNTKLQNDGNTISAFVFMSFFMDLTAMCTYLSVKYTNNRKHTSWVITRYKLSTYDNFNQNKKSITDLSSSLMYGNYSIHKFVLLPENIYIKIAKDCIVAYYCFFKP